MDTNEALARFMTQLARAAEQLAADLTRKPSAPDLVAITKNLGSRQAEALTAIFRAGHDLSTREISDEIAYDFSNCYMTLRRLEQLLLVEQVPGAKPQRWRLRAAA
jgi:DNA-binding MarR family transcriptional regulator